MMPVATIVESHRIGAPAHKASRQAATTPGVNAMSVGRSVCAAAWIIRTTTLATSSGKRVRSASRLMMANDSA